MNSLKVVFCIVMLEAAFQNHASAPGRSPDNQPLQIHLAQLRGDPSPPHFQVELRNRGDRELVLNLGATSNGKRQRLDAIRFVLSNSSGKPLPLSLREGGIGPGRIDPFTVPLPIGAAYSFPVDLKDYDSPSEHVWELNLAPGRYSLRAEYTGEAVPMAMTSPDMKGVALFPIWTGTIHSADLPFVIPRR